MSDAGGNGETSPHIRSDVSLARLPCLLFASCFYLSLISFAFTFRCSERQVDICVRMTSLNELGKVRREIANITAELQRTDMSLAATRGTTEAEFLYTKLEHLRKEKLVLREQEKILLQGSSSSGILLL